jgi:Na+/pantothenate symporter
LSLSLLVTAKLEVLASLEALLRSVLALNALKTDDDLLGGLGLLVENWFSLSTETSLLSVVSTLTLCVEGSFTGLVLSDLVQGVLLALTGSAESLSRLWDVHHLQQVKEVNEGTTR